MYKVIFVGCILFLLSARFVNASPGVEIVQSFPIETTLQVPSVPLTQQVWLDMVNSAKQTLDIEQYYINNVAGQSLEPIVNAILAAASRGVQVRFIIDASFYKKNGNEADSLLPHPNIQVKTIDFSALGGIMHAKYLVVDQSEAYVGSANFDWLALSHIHEVGVHFTDNGLSSNIESIFNLDWAKGISIGKVAATTALKMPHKPSSGVSGVQIVASPAKDLPAGIPDTLSSILSLIGAAKNTLHIQVYEYTTSVYGSSAHWTGLDAAVRAAAARGVQVQLLVDNVAMKAGSSDLNALAKVKNISVKTVTIPQWSGGPLAYARLVHSKYLTVDGASSWVGSENWEQSYFTGTRNVGAILKSSALTAELDQIFDQVWTSSYATAL